MISVDMLKKEFQKAVKSAIYSSRVPGLMGRWDGGSSYTFTVVGGDSRTYVRQLSGDSTTVTTAINEANVAETGDLPIWLERRSDGRLYILGLRYEGT